MENSNDSYYDSDDDWYDERDADDWYDERDADDSSDYMIYDTTHMDTESKTHDSLKFSSEDIESYFKLANVIFFYIMLPISVLIIIGTVLYMGYEGVMSLIN